jgi:multimeric flavodoxin WrbA
MKEIFVLALNGSPNKEGNTAFLLEQVLQAARDKGAKTALIHVMDLLDNLDEKFCTVCSNPCAGVCYRDTELEDAFMTMADTDAIVVGSPVYFGTVSAQLKAIFDKTRKLRADKLLAGKIGAGVSVGASRFGGQETTIRAIHDMMLVHGMALVSDASVSMSLGHYGVCGQKPATDDTEAIKSAKLVGTRLVEECKER